MDEGDWEPILFCTECGAPTCFVDSKIVYHGVSYGMIYLCSRYPVCDARVGCHKATGAPLGTMANKVTRLWRVMAHNAFDPLWKSGTLKRYEAYKIMGNWLGIPTGKAHIGALNIDQCKQVIKMANAYREDEQ